MNNETEANISNFELEQKIEALLFWKGESMSVKDLSKSLDIDADSVKVALVNLESSLKGRGIVLMSDGDEYMLGTSAEASELIEKLSKEELGKELGKASLETLAIILYKGPIKRSEIDYIRGVNSTFILRNLLIRGLINKNPAPNDNRTSVYSTSFELLSHLGVAKIEDLPNFKEVQEEIQKFKDEADNQAEKLSENNNHNSHENE